MTVLKFKTNINCGNCVRAVTGFINEVKGVANWQVDTAEPDKILTVEGDGITAQDVVDAVTEAGFEAQAIPAAG